MGGGAQLEMNIIKTHYKSIKLLKNEEKLQIYIYMPKVLSIL